MWERRHLEKRVKLLDYYSRKEGISGASILEKTVAERAKNELCIKSWGGDDQKQKLSHLYSYLVVNNYILPLLLR